MRDVGIDFYLCDSACELGDKSNFVSCGHGMHLEDFVSFCDVVFPVLEQVIDFFPGFGIAGKYAYERREAVEFIVEGIG